MVRRSHTAIAKRTKLVGVLIRGLKTKFLLSFFKALGLGGVINCISMAPHVAILIESPSSRKNSPIVYIFDFLISKWKLYKKKACRGDPILQTIEKCRTGNGKRNYFDLSWNCSIQSCCNILLLYLLNSFGLLQFFIFISFIVWMRTGSYLLDSNEYDKSYFRIVL